jgi:putative ABC transport system permease protein
MEGLTVSAGMLHKPFIRRQISQSKKQSAVFVLCVALAIVTLVSLNGFSRSVNDSLLKDARTLNAADIIIHSHYELSPPLLEAVASLQKDGLAQSARVYEFYSVVRNAGQENSLLASLKVVGPGYPFYGKVELASGRAFVEVLRPGAIIVEETLLDRLGLHVGDHPGCRRPRTRPTHEALCPGAADLHCHYRPRRPEPG